MVKRQNDRVVIDMLRPLDGPRLHAIMNFARAANSFRAIALAPLGITMRICSARFVSLQRVGQRRPFFIEMGSRVLDLNVIFLIKRIFGIFLQRVRSVA